MLQGTLQGCHHLDARAAGLPDAVDVAALAADDAAHLIIRHLQLR
jgi:hypothetical protein